MAAAGQPPSPIRRGLGIMRILLFFVVFLVAAFIIYRYFTGSGGGANYTTIPEEYQITYVPSDFTPNIDEENALAILSNPQRYRREFNDLIYNFNLSLLYHVANRMGLNDSLRTAIKLEYDEQHPYIRNMYYNDFIAMRDTSGNMVAAWYDSESTTAVDVLNEVASKYTCFLINLIISEVLETQGGKIAAKGSSIDTPCGLALTEGLRPMIERLQSRAAIRDFSRSKGLMQERVEKAVAELATMEVRDKKGLNKQLQTKVWGYSVSTTDIEVSAISILKVGFDLNQYFNIELDPRRNVVTLTLPQPKILSHEVYPKVDKLDIGWLREVQNVDLNRNFDALRREFRVDAMESDMMDKSKRQVTTLMETMMEPMVKAISKNYKLEVQFLGPATDKDWPDYRDNFENLEEENISIRQGNRTGQGNNRINN